MSHSFPFEDDQLQISIQQSLQQIAEQMAHSITQETVEQLYHEAVDLLSHINYTALTLAHVAGTLLVYQVQDLEAEELTWFKAQVKQCPDEDEVEELIESMHRTDAL